MLIAQLDSALRQGGLEQGDRLRKPAAGLIGSRQSAHRREYDRMVVAEFLTQSWQGFLIELNRLDMPKAGLVRPRQVVHGDQRGEVILAKLGLQPEEHRLMQGDRPAGLARRRTGHGQIVDDRERVGVIVSQSARALSIAAS